MPLVRIIANAGQNTDSLARDLRDRGFEVEVASSAAALSAADFEIQLEECSADEVMGRLQSLAHEDITICLSPGTIPAVEGATGAIVDNPNQRVDSEQTWASEPPLTATTEPFPISDTPIAEPVPEEVVEQNVFQSASENAFEQTTPVEALPESVHPEQVNVSEPEPVIQRETNEVWFQEAEPSRQSQSNFQDESQPPALRDADELEFQEVAAVDSSDEGLSDWPIWQLGGEELPAEAIPNRKANRNFAIHLAKLWAETKSWTGINLWAGTRTWLSRLPSPRILRDDRLFSRVATAISATAILLLLYGATAHRFHPLSSTVLRGSQATQAAPFQKKGVLPSNPAANAPEPDGTTSATAPDVALSEAAASPVKPLALRAKMPTARSVDEDGDYVAKDTVVRYTTRRRKPVPASEVRDPGIKYYTDLKNTR